MDELESFEQAVLAQAPPGALLVGASISPDGKHGAALTVYPAANYLMDDVFVRDGDRWELRMAGGGGGIGWSWLGGEEGVGVLRFEGRARAGTSWALVTFQAERHRVPVRHGYFQFVAWNVGDEAQPSLDGFE